MTDQKIEAPAEDVTKTNPPAVDPAPEVEKPKENADAPVDYEKKFSASTTENQRIMAENKAKDEEIERLKKLAESGTSYGDDPGPMYPGFEDLDDEAKKNLIAYTNSLKQGALREVYKDPAIAFARENYNESKWNEAFESVATIYPELKDSKEDFKTKYFRKDNVPENIGDILKDLSKVYLFDKAQDIGAAKAREQDGRLDIERSKGGDKTPVASRTLEDWQKMAAANPAEFAKHSKQYNEDLASGKLK